MLLIAWAESTVELTVNLLRARERILRRLTDDTDIDRASSQELRATLKSVDEATLDRNWERIRTACGADRLDTSAIVNILATSPHPGANGHPDIDAIGPARRDNLRALLGRFAHHTELTADKGEH